MTPWRRILSWFLGRRPAPSAEETYRVASVVVETLGITAALPEIRWRQGDPEGSCRGYVDPDLEKCVLGTFRPGLIELYWDPLWDEDLSQTSFAHELAHFCVWSRGQAEADGDHGHLWRDAYVAAQAVVKLRQG